MKIVVALTLVMVIYAAMPPQVPVIGIFTLPDQGDQPKQGIFQFGVSNNRTYIAASYVKFIQMSGAQVVPIFAFNDTAYLDSILSKINGVLFTGGSIGFDIKNRWTANADHIVKYAMESSSRGNPFPIWGTCLGFELLAYLTSGYDKNVLAPIRNQTAVTNTLQILDRSYLYDGIPDNVRYNLQNGEGIVYFNHAFALHTKYYNSSRSLKSFWSLTSISTSTSSEEFVSTLEAKQYPIFAVQYHPEKNLFEWKVRAVRSDTGAEIVQIISNRFIEYARKNKNSFSSYEEFKKHSIYNWDAHATTMSFIQIYTFDEKVITNAVKEDDQETHLSVE